MTPAPERLLTPQDLAEMCGVDVATVYHWNHKRTGPTVTRVGRLARYTRADVAVWLRANRQPATP